MLPALALSLLLLLAGGLPAAPAAAGDMPPEAPAAVGGVEARLALAHGLVDDLVEQYALAAAPWDPDIRQPAAGALPRWTVPVADEAAHALGALLALRPGEGDAAALARARDAVAAVYDNVAWDRLATEQALVSLGAALGILAASLRPQEAAMPPPDPTPDPTPDLPQGGEVPP